MRLPRWVINIAGIMILISSCGQGSPAESSPTLHSRFYEKSDLRIGSHGDRPGIGFYDAPTNRWMGLDVAVANYVMNQLHISFSTDAPHIYPVQSADREAHLLNGTGDLIIASYSITDERIRQGISFTVPYLLSFQDILIRSSDATAIRKVDDLSGKKVCSGPTNGTPYQHLAALNESRQLHMDLDPQPGVQICVDRLLNREIDAVVSDNAILFGYQAKNSGLHLVGTKVWPRPEQYGIGFIAKTPADAAELNAAIKKMISDGSWAKAIIANFCRDSPTGPPCPLAQAFLDDPPA